MNLALQGSCYRRSDRLTRPAEYQQVFAARKFRSSDRYSQVLVNYNQLVHARLGTAVSKKVSKKAVDRNRIKRLIRESFRLSTIRNRNLDIVFIARPGMSQLSNQEIRELLKMHWSRISKRFNDNEAEI